MTSYDVVAVRRFPASSGVPTFTVIGPIKPTALAWMVEAGGPGRMDVGCTVASLDSAVAAALLDLTVTPLELWLYRDGDLVFAGPLTSYQIQSDAINLYAPGLLYYLRYMVQDADYTVTSTDQATIVAALVDRWQALAFGHFGIDTGHLSASGVTVDLTVSAAQYRTVDQILSEMGGRDNGFELAVAPDTRRLTMAHPRAGQDLTASAILDARSIGKPQYSQAVTAGSLGSEAFATSTSGGGINLTSSSSNTSLRSTFGRTAVSAAFQDVSVQASLDAHAVRLLDDSDNALHSVQPGLVTVAQFGFGDFTAGDVITYDYDAGLGRQTFPVRIRVMTVSVQKGDEQLTLQFV